MRERYDLSKIQGKTVVKVFRRIANGSDFIVIRLSGGDEIQVPSDHTFDKVGNFVSTDSVEIVHTRS